MLIYIQLETCHANPDGSAWYAYFDDDEISPDEIKRQVLGAYNNKSEKYENYDNSGPLSLINLDDPDGDPINLDDIEEVPSPLSRAAGFKRFYIGDAG